MKKSVSSALFPRKDGKKVTLRSIATELAIAPATVMRALSGHPNVRPELREKIVRYASQAGYRLPRRSTGRVAIITEGKHFPGYLALLLSCLCEELYRRGFQVSILPAADADSFNDFLYDGIISTTWIPGFERKYPKEHALPLVIINAMDNRTDGVYKVTSDEIGGISMGMQCLYDAGCRKILFPVYQDEENTVNMNERIAAFQAFCRAHAMPGEELVAHISDRPGHLLHVVEKALADGIDGVFVASECFALPVMNTLLQLGVKIPEELSFLGFEFDLASRYMQPAMTTIRQNYERTALESVSMLLKQINGKHAKSNVRIPYKLVERDSVRKVR